jgi:hypothetical protein
LMHLSEPAAEQLLAERTVDQLLDAHSAAARLRVAEALPDLEEPANPAHVEQRRDRE